MSPVTLMSLMATWPIGLPAHEIVSPEGKDMVASTDCKVNECTLNIFTEILTWSCICDAALELGFYGANKKALNLNKPTGLLKEFWPGSKMITVSRLSGTGQSVGYKYSQHLPQSGITNDLLYNWTSKHRKYKGKGFVGHCWKTFLRELESGFVITCRTSRPMLISTGNTKQVNLPMVTSVDS